MYGLTGCNQTFGTQISCSLPTVSSSEYVTKHIRTTNEQKCENANVSARVAVQPLCGQSSHTCVLVDMSTRRHEYS